MKKVLLLSIIVLMSLLASYSFANVMAFDVKLDTSGANPKVTYRLNEAATSVIVQICGPSPSTAAVKNITGTTLKGANEVIWDKTIDGGAPASNGAYSVKVQANDAVGHTAWSLINDITQPIFQYEYPRHLEVNKNVKSPYFGMIYLANGRVGTTGTSKACSDGIYAMYPDGSDPLGQAGTPATGGVAWSVLTGTGTLDGASPWKPVVGPDDSVYICDWSDTHSGIWRAPADLSGSYVEILDNTGRASSGLVGTLHGSVSSVLVEGTGASTTLYTWDEDLPLPGASTTTEPGLRNIYKYAVGTGPFPWTAAPTTQISELDFTSYIYYDAAFGIFVNDSNAGLKRDSSGNWYVSNYRAGVGMPTLLKISPDGKTLLWDSLNAGNGGNTSDPLIADRGGIAIDEVRNRIYVGISGVGFKYIPFNPLPTGTGALDAATVSVTVTEGGFTSGSAVVGLDVDGAGNVYFASTTREYLYIYSPPGANSYTTDTNLTITVTGAVPTPTPDPSILSADKSWGIYE